MFFVLIYVRFWFLSAQCLLGDLFGRGVGGVKSGIDFHQNGNQ